MKTRVNGIPKIQAPCPWRRFGRSSEKRRRGDTTFCMLILFSSLIVSLSKDVLSRTNVNRKCVFWILGQYSAEQYDAQFFGQSFLLRLLLIEIWVSWHIKKQIKVFLPIDVCRTPLLELPIKRRKKRQCCAKIKKKENVQSVPCHNANGNGSKGCQKLCIGCKTSEPQYPHPPTLF